MIRVTKHVFVSALFTMIVIAACTGTAQAQGSRKDDIVFNAQGRPMAGATVRICASGATGEPCAPLAQIYSDLALTQALANPLSTDGMGNYSFYAAPGLYMIEIDGPGITTKQIPNVILPSDPSSPTFASVTTTSGISAFSLTLTGNLTVNGSAAVVGSFTVGGAPVPSTNADNQWTSNQRFKGPDPWRDVTAYMPAGGCSTTDRPDTNYLDYSAGISGYTLSLNGTYLRQNFKNGCGIIITGAGPTSTISPPGAGGTISSITRSGGTATVTFSAPHGIMVESSNIAFGVVIAGVTDSSFDGTFPVLRVPDATHITYALAGSATSSGGTATTLWGYAHGVTGSTTYNYKLVSVDGNMGYSAATGPITISNGNATLSPESLNYNWLNIPPVQNSYMVAVYSDKGLGGAYSCVGVTFNMGYSDYGLSFPCPLFLPATPPTSAGNQAFNTTIVSGGGTATLTLAAAAPNGGNIVLHDESSFLQACIADVIADQAAVGGSNGSSLGCYIPASPAGTYWMNGLLPTATQTPSGIVRIDVAGTLFFATVPWFVGNSGYDIEGVGGGGSVASHYETGKALLVLAPTVPAAFVIRKGAITTINNFSIPNLNGHGIWMGDTWDAGGSTGGSFNNLDIEEAASGAGVPMWFDNNVINVDANNMVLTASYNNDLPFAAFTMSDYGGNTLCCITFGGALKTFFRGFRVDAPGGNVTGGGISAPYISGWMSESNRDAYMANFDNGPNAPGTSYVNAWLGMGGVDNADSPAASNVHARYGNFNFSSGSVSIGSPGASYLLSCGPDPSCDNPGGYAISMSGPDANAPGSIGGEVGFSTNNIRTMVLGNPFILKPTKYQLANYYTMAWGMMLPPASSFAASAGSGSLAAQNWCAVVYGEGYGGYTDSSHEVCTTTGASSSVSFSWDVSKSSGMYTGWRLYYGVGSGNENKYYEVGTSGTFALTSDGGTSAAPPTGTPNAYISAFNWNGGGCLYCNGMSGNPYGKQGFGIGVVPGYQNGVMLDVGNGAIRAQSGLILGTTLYPTIQAAATPGTPAPICLPTATAAHAGDYLVSNAGTSPCQQTSWVTPAVTPNVQSGTSYTIQQSDNGIPVYFTSGSSVAVTLNAPSSYSTGFYSCIDAEGAGTVTITASGNVNGNATLAIAAKNHACIQTNGSTWYAMTSVGF